MDEDWWVAGNRDSKLILIINENGFHLPTKTLVTELKERNFEQFLAYIELKSAYSNDPSILEPYLKDLKEREGKTYMDSIEMLSNSANNSNVTSFVQRPSKV